MNLPRLLPHVLAALRGDDGVAADFIHLDQDGHPRQVWRQRVPR